MGVVVHPGRLRLEMARRGWSATDLARESGISRPTISAALAGKAIAARSVGLLGLAFARVPAEPAIDSLILGDRDGLT
jgi:transcriptional regulator with XRE-family HTH domain